MQSYLHLLCLSIVKCDNLLKFIFQTYIGRTFQLGFFSGVLISAKTDYLDFKSDPSDIELVGSIQVQVSISGSNIKFSSDLRAKILHFCGFFAQKLNQQFSKAPSISNGFSSVHSSTQKQCKFHFFTAQYTFLKVCRVISTSMGVRSQIVQKCIEYFQTSQFFFCCTHIVTLTICIAMQKY